MKNKRFLDKKKRISFKKQELYNKVYKILLIINSKQKNNYFYSDLNRLIIKLITNLKTSGSKTKFKNRCIITGRSGAVYSQYKISRIILKKLVSQNSLNGFYKDSW